LAPAWVGRRTFHQGKRCQLHLVIPRRYIH
jgi:hypothetical protein